MLSSYGPEFNGEEKEQKVYAQKNKDFRDLIGYRTFKIISEICSRLSSKAQFRKSQIGLKAAVIANLSYGPNVGRKHDNAVKDKI